METVKFSKHTSLANHEFECLIVERITTKVLSLRNYHELKGDLDLLHFICNCIEAEEKTYSMEQKKEFNRQLKSKSFFSFSKRTKRFIDKYFDPDVKKSIALNIIFSIFANLTPDEEKSINNQLEFLYTRNLVVRPTAFQLFFSDWYHYLFVDEKTTIHYYDQIVPATDDLTVKKSFVRSRKNSKLPTRFEETKSNLKNELMAL